jgi:hypothetical protein
MAERCFKKNEINPPSCGAHHVPLILCKELLNPDAPYLGYITCLECPLSGTVVLDSKGFRERPSTEKMPL